jgi:glycolate oxidase iron-sulfur subunit
MSEISSQEKQSQGVIDKQLLDACIHCGLCLPACPTYLATGREMESPRGRIYLLTQWNEGTLPLDSRLAEHIDSCLGCFGCQTACPSGVQYASILDQARPHILATKPGYQRLAMRFGFKSLLPDYPRLHMLAGLMRFWQQLNGSELLRKLAAVKPNQAIASADPISSNPLRKLFYRLWQLDALLPEIPSFKPLPKKSWKSGEKKGTVQLFAGCVMDVFYNSVNHASIDLLKAQGHVVEVPEQTCCGALAAHAGETEIMLALAKRNIRSLDPTKGPIVVTSAGCGAMMKQYGEYFHKDEEYAARAAAFSERVVDITEELAKYEFERKDGAEQFPDLKIAYHAACHLAHAQGIREAPQKLLLDFAADVNARANLNNLDAKSGPNNADAKSSPNNADTKSSFNKAEAKSSPNKIELIPLREAEHCCGSAGIYNLLHTELSMEVLNRKMDLIAESGADTVVTTNPGCMLQIKAGVKQRRLPVQVLHLCELLRDFYCAKDE